MKLLIIGYVWPEPRSSAAGGHMMSLISTFLHQDWEITFASPAQETTHQTDLNALGIETTAIALNCESFDGFVTTLAPDVVLFDRFMMEEQFGWRVAEHCPSALRVLDTEDLHSLREARQKAYNAQRPATQEDLVTEKAMREIAAIYRCDLTLVISDYEMRVLKETYKVPPQLLWHLPFMLSGPKVIEEQCAFEAREHFVFIGNFRHPPNWDAVQWLRSDIWPKIRKQLPTAELHIYGAYPPPKATALHKPEQGFYIKGWAEDAYQVLAQARICLAPLRFGAGIKGKLTDAMQCGTPSITTAIGAEGIAPIAEWTGTCVDNLNPQAIADAASALYQDSGAWHKAQTGGFRLLDKKFNGPELQQGFYQHILELLNNLSQHRLDNFTGAMLNHHAHRSTKFMAQWIEAKNKLSDTGNT